MESGVGVIRRDPSGYQAQSVERQGRTPLKTKAGGGSGPAHFHRRRAKSGYVLSSLKSDSPVMTATPNPLIARTRQEARSCSAKEFLQQKSNFTYNFMRTVKLEKLFWGGLTRFGFENKIGVAGILIIFQDGQRSTVF